MTADILSIQCKFDLYLFSRHRLVIASSAFGLGVDIEDIRRVVFLQPPATTSELVQRIWRVGRDGGLCEVQVHYNNLEHAQGCYNGMARGNRKLKICSWPNAKE